MTRSLESATAARPAVPRQAGAPRLIGWTGERCVPWAPDVQVTYEHYHRYLWAARLVEGRRVLDLASGEGFGSAILAARAASVVGIDIDGPTVEHSRLNYVAPNLEFRLGSALDLSAFEPGSFDVVVAFEMIEHLEDHAALLEQIDRVLAADGMLVISTPDRRIYTDGHGQDNPFHVHELDEPEFRAALGARFSNVMLWGQRTTTGSRIAALDDGAAERALPLFLERSGDEWRECAGGTPLYLIAVAGHVPFDAPPAESDLADYGLELMREQERVAAAARAETAVAQAERDRAEEDRRSQEDEAARQHELLTERARVHDQDLRRLTGEVIQSRGEVEQARAEAAEAWQRLSRYEQSATWMMFQKARGRLYGRIGQDSLPGRALQGVLRTAGRGVASRNAPAAIAPPPAIRFPHFEEPVASLVIPVHSQADLTAACLRSILMQTEAPSYEVVLVDDTADEATKRLLSVVENATILVNEENLGFLRSMNKGCAAARGRHVVLFNNDTEVRPGWLTALVDRAESAADIAVVTPKFIFPDGRLQEAGGIVFRDGSAWNFGRGDAPYRPQYNYVREVDYGSAAALLVRKDVFDELGGFDERFAPIYYEDTDLCFAARRAGYRVMYEPAAEVVHVEGATSGTDTSAGSKRHQALNGPKFVAKWADELERQPRPAPQQVRRLSDRNRGPHVLVIDHRVPTPDQDSGSLRMLNMLQALQAHGCRISFLPDNLATMDPYSRQLRDMGIEVIDGPVELWPELAAIGQQLRLVIASRPYVAPRYLHILREFAPAAKVVYDTVDLHFLREARRGQVGANTAATAVATSMREIELGLARACDATLLVTEEERSELAAALPDARLIVVPNAHELTKKVPPPEGREGLLFVGGFEHLPNVDAAQYLVRSIMPEVWRRIGDVSLTIAGSKPPPDVWALASSRVEVTGYVPDLDPVIDGARLLVAPLRYGAGMKGKVTQSLAAGLPVVTTAVGAEGLGAVDGQDLMLAEDAEAFAQAIASGYRDDQLWRRLSANGQAVVERVCSTRTMEERIGEVLALAQ